MSGWFDYAVIVRTHRVSYRVRINHWWEPFSFILCPRWLFSAFSMGRIEELDHELLRVFFSGFFHAIE